MIDQDTLQEEVGRRTKEKQTKIVVMMEVYIIILDIRENEF
ncbi:hypothetical protein ACT7DB_00790 [Bacillus cereus]